MVVLYGVIHTNTLLENILSVIVTHFNDLSMSPDLKARVWRLWGLRKQFINKFVFHTSAHLICDEHNWSYYINAVFANLCTA